MKPFGPWIFAGAALTLSACRPTVPTGALVLTQIPRSGSGATHGEPDLLDRRYPPGSRVVLARPPFDPQTVRVLSRGLFAAGGPLLAPDGRDVYFAGKSASASPWQVYRTPVTGGQPRVLTTIAGGAMDPALLPDGSLVFSSPVPGRDGPWSGARPPALFVQRPGGKHPQQITFGPYAALDPTVLRDGRILFVAGMPPGPNGSAARSALFTVNSDGTEFTPYACQEDEAGVVRRPRELGDDRIGFLAGAAGSSGLWGRAEDVRSTHPSSSREALLPAIATPCHSVEPASGDGLLVACESGESTYPAARGSFAIFRVKPGASGLGAPLFDDPAHDDIEAIGVELRPEPMGHLSTVKPGSATGLILCLDVNRTALHPATGGSASAAVRIRVLTQAAGETVRALGELPVAPDGSFFAEVPADLPLGFEALDARGNVLRRSPPSVWVRPGENRSCVGCHEAPNQAPPNRRPLAVKAPPVRVGELLTTLAREEGSL